MRISLLIFVAALLPFCTAAQIPGLPKTDTTPYQYRQRPSVARAYAMLATDTRFSLNISGEFRLFHPVTLFITGGPAVDRRFINNDNLAGGGEDTYLVSAIAGAELRCYAWLRNRQKKGKISRNYSAPYIAVQGLAQSGGLPFLPAGGDAIKGHTSGWLNLGWQQEQNKTWVSVFAGVQLTNFSGNSNNARTGRLHAGITVGKVL